MDQASSVFIIKLAGACNLNCSYCYVYNLGDTSFNARPRVMDRQVAVAAVSRIAEYAERHALPEVRLVLHGGEPLLAGKEWMKWFLDLVYDQVAAPRIGIGIQSNGTLLDAGWVRLFGRYRVGVGISMDGLPEFHDRFRVNFAGRGSYAKVRRAIELLRDAAGPAPEWGVLVVANPECPGVEVFEHLRSLGVRRMDFLWPDYHHDAPPPWKPGVLADYFTTLFDRWYGLDDPGTEIRFFTSVIKGLMGRGTGMDALGTQPLSEVVIEADGAIEPLDVLRICGDRFTCTGLNVLTHPLDDIGAGEVFREGLRKQELLPPQCHACPAYETCGGGYLPHRWGQGRRFANASVHCQDLLAVIRHVHRRVSGDLLRARSASARARRPGAGAVAV